MSSPPQNVTPSSPTQTLRLILGEMVIGNFVLLAGFDVQALHRWYPGIYVDAFDWVELPNTLGMSQFADGGLLATNPYVSSAAYIDRMSDYCKGGAFDDWASQSARSTRCTGTFTSATPSNCNSTGALAWSTVNWPKCHLKNWLRCKPRPSRHASSLTRSERRTETPAKAPTRHFHPLANTP